MLHHFNTDRDEIWRDCSASKYASTDGVGFLRRRHDFKVQQKAKTGVGRRRRSHFTAAGGSRILIRRPPVPDPLVHSYLFDCMLMLTFCRRTAMRPITEI